MIDYVRDMMMMMMMMMMMIVFLDRLSMWNMLSCAEQVQVQNTKLVHNSMCPNNHAQTFNSIEEFLKNVRPHKTQESCQCTRSNPNHIN